MNTTLTEKYLKDIGACKDGITFTKRNNLIGFPLNRLHEVEGDFNGFVEFLKNDPSLEYDDKGNVVKKTYSNGDICQYEYDDKGNIIKEFYDNGYICQYEYDHIGNVVKMIHPDGRMSIWKYNFYENGQLKEILKGNRKILSIPLF